MSGSSGVLWIARAFLAIVWAMTLAVGPHPACCAVPPEHRGVWMHASYIKTPAQADRCVALMERANVNAVYMLVWYWGGQAGFQSRLCPMLEGVQAGYDPLGYMIRECHRRQIEVHAWFVNGHHGNATPVGVLAQHPDWAVETGGESGPPWYDLGKPEVRKFQSDLMIEALTRYDLDGLHFDYIRYNGPAICYCKHCQTEFAGRYGCGPIERPSRRAFPIADQFAGNPVAGPTTAQVLAQFSDGTPAIAANTLGKGRVLLFNWHALRSLQPAVAETWRRALRQWNASPEKVFVIDTAPNRKRYGDKGAKEAAAALASLGCKAAIVAEDRLAGLPPGSLVVLSDVYLIPDDFAEALERFVRDGGLLVVVDGPVHAMRNASIQRVLGMRRTASYINRMELIQPVGTSALVPSDGARLDLKPLVVRLDRWAEYRKAGVTELVRDVYRRAKQAKPKTLVTAAVFTPVASAQRAYQDWPAWIREGIVDYVLPMAYTPKNAQLEKQIQDWKTVDPRLDRVVPGLCISSQATQGDYAHRDIDLILAQHRMCREAGAPGVNFYALDNTDASPMLMLTEPLIAALQKGPFAGKAPAYRPPAAGSAAAGLQEPPRWECDFGKSSPTSWQWQNAGYEVVGGALRVRVPTVPQKNYGTFGQSVPATPAGCYLQVLLGDTEDSSAAPWVGNASAGGKEFGKLLTGWNTFSMVDNADRPLLLSFGQHGNRREATGPWVDYKLARTVTTPAEGLVVTLTNDADGVAQVGDTLLFRYYSSAPLGKKLTARAFLLPGFLEYRFTKNKLVELTDAEGKGVYTAEVVIDQDALAFQSAGGKQRMMAMTTVNGVNSYYSLPFRLDIRTANVLPPVLAAAANMQVREDRQLWLDLTRGANLALGRPLQFIPAPDYRLTTDPGDATDLTDGKLSGRTDDKIWFDRQAVGWYFGGGTSYIRLDLGREEPVERLVIRCLGGTRGNFAFPARFDLYVSRDGRDYHAAASMQKLMPNEASQSDFRRYYYLEETASQYNTRMYPFALNVQADARYILLKVTGASDSIFTDELAVLKVAHKAPEHNAAYRNPGMKIPMEGLIIRPRVAELAIIRGIPAPQRFNVSDMRSEAGQKEAASLVLELPQGLSVVGDYAAQPVLKNNASYRRYEFPLKRAGRKRSLSSPTLYLAATAEEARLPAYVYGRSAGVDQFTTALPVRIVTLPDIPPFTRVHVSLSWMGEAEAQGWPDFLRHWRRLGFNAVATFPRYWNPQLHEEKTKFVADARAAGYAVIMNDSPFHMMMHGQREGSEIYCQIPGKKHTMLCPSYRGEWYGKEMARVERCARMSRPDYVFYDIECWHDAVSSAPECARCRAAWKASGKTMPEFLFDCGTRQSADLAQAVKRGAAAAGVKTPVIGSYSRELLRPKYGVELFDRTYPAYIDLAQPSLYVAGRAQDVHDRIRGNHKLMKNKKIIPWLSAGTYGEFDSAKMEHMVLEAMLNGAGGITYYCFGDFTDSPLDFYYHAKALAQLRPYEDLVVEGEVLEPDGSNPALTCSALKKGGELLLLVGNYRNAEPRTSFALPFRTVAEIKDLRSGQGITSGSRFTFEVPKGGIRLFYVKEGAIR